MSEIKWIRCTKATPPTEVKGCKEYLATVTCDTWKVSKTMCVEWENTTVRGKDASRWLWRDRLFPSCWEIVAWAEMPEPCALTAE